GVALPVAPRNRGLELFAGLGGAAGELELVEGDGRIFVERLDRELHMVREGLLVRVLEIRGEPLHKFIESLRETLRAGVERLERDPLRGRETDIAAHPEAVGEAGVIGAEDRLADTRGDERRRELLLAR